MKKKLKIENTPKYPALTSEEVEALLLYDKEFIDDWGGYGMKMNWIISMALSHLALDKMVGNHGYKKNLKQAKEHYLKSLVFTPYRKYQDPAIRKCLGLPPPTRMPKGYKELSRFWEGSLRLRKIARKNNPKMSFRGNGK